MEAKPLQITIPSTLSGKLYTKSWEKEEWKNMMVVDQMKKSSGSVVKEEEGSPPSIKLGLGIGKIGNHVVEQGQGSKRAIMLTPAQLNELEKQALIYKYIAAGLPVPLYLLLPIWKSLASSSGFVNGGIYKQYPSFIGFNPQGFDYRTMMDPEPKRCRRTDGKKWRCSKDVVPNEKYCERHIHRGRQRSRKHVELPKTACPSITKTPINDNNTGNSTTHLSISVPIGLQLRIPTCDTNITSIVNPSTAISANRNNEGDDNFGLRKDSTPTAIPIPTTTIVAATAADTNKSSRCNVDGKENRNSYVKQYLNVNRSCNNVEIGSKVSPMLGFSPDSVLQRPTILGYRSSCADYGSYIDPEPQRCRRTDGKKWRCSNDVVPDKKYCVRHMHRGAKRQKEGCQADAIAVADSRCAPAAKISKTEDSINMNTNLSMGISTNSQVVLINYERSTTTTSSSETISANSSCHEYSTAARA